MSYQIELVQSGIAGARPTMFRSGIKFSVGEPLTLNLTKEEAEVFVNDWRFKVSAAKDTGATLAEAKAATGEVLPSAVDIAGEEKPAAEIEAIENQLAAQEKVVDDKGKELSPLDALLRDYSREELNKQAKALGIKKPGDFGNKTEVAQAIVDAQ